MSRFDTPILRGVLIGIVALLLVVACFNGARLFQATRAKNQIASDAMAEHPAAALPPGPPIPHEDKPQRAPTPEKDGKDPYQWVSVKPNGAGLTGAPALQPAVLVGNFDRDPDQECIVFTPGGEYHWLCEADGSRQPLHLPGFDSRGCLALDVNDDGVDELIAGSLAVHDPGVKSSTPAIDLQGKVVGKVPWAGSRLTDPLFRADYDGKPGKEFFWADKQAAQIFDAAGNVLFAVGHLPPGGFSGALPLIGDFDGDKIWDCLTQAEAGGPDGVDIQVQFGNAAHPLAKAPLFPEGRNPPMQHYLADLDGDGIADLIFPGGYLSHVHGWKEFAVPMRLEPGGSYFIQGLTPEHTFVVPAALLAGDFDHDGKTEAMVACRDLTPEQGPDGKPVPYTEFWFFGPDGKLLRGSSRAAALLPSDCWVLHAGGKDHLVLAYTDSVRISQ